MTINEFRKLLLQLVPAISIKGLLRLDHSEKRVKLPLINLPTHGDSYHSNPTATATKISTDTTNFDNLLSTTESDVQKALDVLDDLSSTTFSLDTTQFDNNLSVADDTIQKAFNTLDDLTAIELVADTTKFNNLLSSADNTVQKALDTLDNVLASSFKTNTTNFNHNLSKNDNTIQRALDTLDNVTMNIKEFSEHRNQDGEGGFFEPGVNKEHNAKAVYVEMKDFDGNLVNADYPDAQSMFDKIDDFDLSGSDLDTSNFNNNLSSADDTPQKAFDTLDDIIIADAAVNTANFDNKLSSLDNTIQKALDTLDDAGGNTLDQAYDQGGVGAGKTITADSGALRVTDDGIWIDNIQIDPGTPLTISSGGTITTTEIYHTVDTYGSAATDNLDGIAAGEQGQIIFIRPYNSSRSVVVRHNQNAGANNNILLTNGGDVTLSSTYDVLMLMYETKIDGGSWIQLNRYTDTQAVSAVEAAEGTLSLSAKTVEIGDGYNPLGNILTLKYGDAPDTKPLLYIDSIAYANTTEQAIGIAASGNYIFGANRNGDDKISSWEMSKARASTQVGIVRGSGYPNYLKSPVVVALNDDATYAAVAAYGDDSMAFGDNSLTIVDVSDKENPTVVSHVVFSGDDLLDGIACVFWKGDYVYVTSFNSNAFLIYDVTDPTLPKLAGGAKGSSAGSTAQGLFNGTSWTTTTDTNWLWGASAVHVYQVSGSLYAAVASRKDGSLSIYDVTVPSAVSLKSVDEHTNGGTTTDYHELAGAITTQIEYHSGDAKYYVYTGTRWQGYTGGDGYGVNATNGWDNEWHTGNRQGSVVIHEVSTSGILTYKGNITGKGSPNYLSEVHWIKYVQDSGTYAHEYVYCAAFGDDCVTIIDVSTKTAPTFVCTFGSVGSPGYTQGAVGLDVVKVSNDAKYLYAAAFFDNGFTIWDVENASATNIPTRVGGRAGSGVSGDPYYLEDSHSIKADANNYIYVMSRGDSNSLNVFSVESSVLFGTAPADTFTDGTYMTTINRIAVNGTHLYVAAYGVDYLKIIDISTPTAMASTAQIGGAGSPNYCDGITSVVVGFQPIAMETWAVVTAFNDNAITTFDVSTPGSPTLNGSYQSATHLAGAYDVAINSNLDRAYVAAYSSNALVVLSISGAGVPTYLNEAANSGYTTGAPNFLGGARAIVLFKTNYVAVCAKADNALSIFSIAGVDATNAPSRLKTFQGVGSPNYCGGIEDICADSAEDYLYFVARDDDAVVQVDVSDPTNAFISGVISGVSNYLDEAIRIKVATIQGEEFIIVASYLSGRFVVLKRSDFTRSNVVGLRNYYGDVQVRHAFGSWAKV